jgi:hypothetical protein
MTIRKLAGLCAIAAAGAAAPVSFDPGDPVFRLQQACGQATECEVSANYICSTAHADHKGYKCSRGCLLAQT